MEVAFNQRTLLSWPVPQAKELVLKDSGCPHLRCRVTPKGKRSYFFYGWSSLQQKPIKRAIGPVDKVSVIQARARADELKAEVSSTRTPDWLVRRQMTLSDLYQDYMQGHVESHCTEHTAINYERLWDRELSDYSKVTLSRLTPEQCRKIHRSIDSQYSANRTIQLLKAMCGYAIRLGYLELNPCASVKLYKENKRRRALTQAETKDFARAAWLELRATNHIGPAYCLLALATGLRRGNLSSLTWDQVDWSTGRVHFGGEAMKNRSDHQVFLGAFGKEILGQVPEVSKFIFASETAQAMHISEPKTAIARVVKHSEVKAKVSSHVLRHTFCSLLPALNVHPAVASVMAGHRTGSITLDTYTHVSEDSVRQGFLKVDKRLRTWAESKKPEKKKADS